MRTWRKVSWAIVIWTAAFALWAISGPVAVVELVGPTVDFSLLATLWFAGTIVLTVIWLVSRPRNNAIA